MRRQRSSRGGAIAETGPALFMFLVIIFFPMLDLIGIGAQYACGWYHNHLMLQELPVRLKAQGPLVSGEVKGRFEKTGLHRFAGITSITDTVTYVDAAAGIPAMVRCTTVIQGKPFIALPFLGFTETRFQIGGEATREVIERDLSSLSTPL